MARDKNRISDNGGKQGPIAPAQTTTVAEQLIIIRDSLDQVYKLVTSLTAALIEKAKEKT